MEILLQWLDELDDLVFAGLTLWRRLRRLCLAVALGAALGLHLLPPLGVAGPGVLSLLDVALLALVVWTLAAAVAAAAEASGHSMARRGRSVAGQA